MPKDDLNCIGLSLCGGPCDNSCPAWKLMNDREFYKKKEEVLDKYQAHTDCGELVDRRTMQAWDLDNFKCGICDSKNISIMILKVMDQMEMKEVIELKLMCRSCLNQSTVKYKK